MWDTHWMRTHRWAELKILIEGLVTQPMPFALDGVIQPTNRVQDIVYGPRIDAHREQMARDAERERVRNR